MGAKVPMVLRLVGEEQAAATSRGISPRLVLRRLDDVVWGSMLLVLAGGACVGGAMADQAGRQAMRLLGDQSFIGLEYPVLGIQEFCPLVVAIVLAQRVGAGFAAELASLKADGTFDALTLYGANPWRDRVWPMAIALPLGSVLCSLMALIAWEASGTVVMLARSGVNPFTFVHPEVVTPSLLGFMVLKASTFGAMVFVGAAQAGLRRRQSNAGKVGDGVGHRTTQGVVLGTLYALALNLVFDLWWHLS